jgi:molybdenum-dependent DNA-binding transcriptional regulator ModE
MILIGGRKPQQRKPSKKNWTKAQQIEFLSVLAETCNVTRACAQAGISVTHAYRKRKSDAAFRAGWIEAIGIAYQRLELAMLNRAFNGTEKVVKRRDGSEERVHEVSNQLGLALLKLHRDSAAEANIQLPQQDVDEMREQLVKKLLRLKKRLEKDQAASA